MNPENFTKTHIDVLEHTCKVYRKPKDIVCECNCTLDDLKFLHANGCLEIKREWNDAMPAAEAIDRNLCRITASRKGVQLVSGPAHEENPSARTVSKKEESDEDELNGALITVMKPSEGSIKFKDKSGLSKITRTAAEHKNTYATILASLAFLLGLVSAVYALIG